MSLLASLAFFTRLPTGTTSGEPSRIVLGAPIVGLLLAALATPPGGLLLASGAPGAPWLAATATVAAVAYLSRGLHLDGLADLADGLGSGRAPVDAVRIMQRSDIGPFGVMVLVLTIAFQIGALGAAAAALGWQGMAAALAISLLAGRTAVVWLCRRGATAAPGSRLGAWAVGSVPTPAALGAAGAAAAVAGLLGWFGGLAVWVGPACVAAALLVGAGLQRTARRRFGGTTGDVLGACVELAGCSSLLVLLFALPIPVGA